MSYALFAAVVAISVARGGVWCWWSSSAPDPPVRLVGGNETSGVVQVYLNDAWGTICDDDWRAPTAASVTCRQLGFVLVRPVSRAPGEFKVDVHAEDNRRLPIHITNIHCTGQEVGLLDCTHANTTSCDHDEDAGVYCDYPITTTPEPTTTGEPTTTEEPSTPVTTPTPASSPSRRATLPPDADYPAGVPSGALVTSGATYPLSTYAICLVITLTSLYIYTKGPI